MTMAMPPVKPDTTGSGIYLIQAPRRSTPAAIRIRPSTPCRAMTPATTTTKAPVGPPIWNRLPPRPEMMDPATAAVSSPTSGRTPEAIAEAMAKGRATTATVSPATRSARRSAKA